MIVYRLDVDRFEYELMESDAAPHEEYTKSEAPCPTPLSCS